MQRASRKGLAESPERTTVVGNGGEQVSNDTRNGNSDKGKGIRRAAFLELPEAYPEYQGLIEYSPWWHEWHKRFQQYRTFCLAGGLVAYSSACFWTDPSVPVVESVNRTLGLDALARHFSGLDTAMACAVLSSALCIWAYPIQKACRSRHNLSLFLPLAPCVLSWILAFWASLRHQWGVGAGLWLALLVAAYTMKVASFAQAVASKAAGEGGEAGPRATLPFRRFMKFLFLVPSLVCYPALLAEEARLPRRPFKALSEFFHAALTFICAHTLNMSLAAPAFRGMTAAWVSCWWGGGGAVQFGYFLLWATWAVLLCPCERFLGFYGHWHCVCSGFAQLTGYPDHNTYGPYWLVRDDPALFFRLWSRPVHKWLHECLHRPVSRSWARARADRIKPPAVLAASPDKAPQEQPPQDDPMANGTPVHSGPSSPLLSASGSVSPPKRHPRGSSTRAATMLVTFLVSSLAHECILFVAFRRCWPICSFNLLMAAGVILTWKTTFPRPGLFAKVIFAFASLVFDMVCQYVAWHWWRSAFLSK